MVVASELLKFQILVHTHFPIPNNEPGFLNASLFLSKLILRWNRKLINRNEIDQIRVKNYIFSLSFYKENLNIFAEAVKAKDIQINYYSKQRVFQFFSHISQPHSWISLSKIFLTTLYIYIYACCIYIHIYIYIYVCVCICICSRPSSSVKDIFKSLWGIIKPNR